MGEFEDIVEQIADAGLLTEKQAVAYLGREIDGAAREQVAAYLDCAPNTVDNHRRAAIDKVEAARETLAIIDEYEQNRYPPVPDACSECGGSIDGMFVRTDEGEPLCRDCADVEVPDGW